MEYKIKVKELDDYTHYPVEVLCGMTGLGQATIEKLEREGKFRFRKNAQGERTVKGKDFLDWSNSVNHLIEVEKTDYSIMDVPER